MNLETGQVTTLAGTGCQGNDQEGGAKGTQQPLSTPWDVAVGVSPGGKRFGDSSYFPNMLFKTF